MCGIFSIINSDVDRVKNTLIKYIAKNKKRGPETENYSFYGQNIFFAFHRLAINGLNIAGNQPMFYKKYIIICNGEIFNYKDLIQQYNITPKSKSDIEVLLHLYEKFDIDFLNYINGEFSFILYDGIKNKIIIARDQFGIRPLYYNVSNKKSIKNDMHLSETNQKNIYCFSSTLSSMVDMENLMNKNIKQFTPGHYMILRKNELTKSFEFESIKQFTQLPAIIEHNYLDYNIGELLYYALKSSVSKRILTSERPIGALLSGGLDSSLICALSQQILKENNKPPLETFSIGLPGSEDLKYSSSVANYIGSKHHQIILSQEDFLNAIPNVIYDIESYDTTTVRASVGNWLIGKYIKENTDIKVILNGDGADELFGGYLYFHKAPNNMLFDEECKRLLKYIHYYDVLRSDRSISSHGLEPRTPFLDKNFVNIYLQIQVSKRNHVNYDKFYVNKKQIEKFLIRDAVQKNDTYLLPNEILWRQKEAFSDGVSSMQKSWYQIVQEHINNLVMTDKNLSNDIEKTIYPTHLDCNTLEQKYYYVIFNRHFKNCSELIPFYWMPNFIKANDCSARTLKTIYNEIKETKETDTKNIET